MIASVIAARFCIFPLSLVWGPAGLYVIVSFILARTCKICVSYRDLQKQLGADTVLSTPPPSHGSYFGWAPYIFPWQHFTAQPTAVAGKGQGKKKCGIQGNTVDLARLHYQCPSLTCERFFLNWSTCVEERSTEGWESIWWLSRKQSAASLVHSL